MWHSQFCVIRTTWSHRKLVELQKVRIIRVFTEVSNLPYNCQKSCNKLIVQYVLAQIKANTQTNKMDFRTQDGFSYNSNILLTLQNTSKT